MVASVYMGLESGSETVLRYLKADTVSVEQNQKAIDLLTARGIIVEGSFIIGSPCETMEDCAATHDFILDNYRAGKLNYTSIKLLTPYPGTVVWEYALSRGLVDDHMDWTRLHMGIESFDPWHCVYLNEMIPLEEFVDCIEIFADLSRRIRHFAYYSSPEKADLKDRRRRLDTEKLQRFKRERMADR